MQSEIVTGNSGLGSLGLSSGSLGLSNGYQVICLGLGLRESRVARSDTNPGSGEDISFSLGSTWVEQIFLQPGVTQIHPRVWNPGEVDFYRRPGSTPMSANPSLSKRRRWKLMLLHPPPPPPPHPTHTPTPYPQPIPGSAPCTPFCIKGSQIAGAVMPA